MFYKEEDINEGLTCPKCKDRLDDPRLIPCGETYCNSCIYDLARGNALFKCLSCHSEHHVPEAGFPPNKILLKLLNKTSYEVYRSSTIESFKEILKSIRTKTNDLEHSMVSSADKVREYCDFKRNDIQIVAESSIISINNFREGFLKEVDDYERDCLANIEVNGRCKEKCKNFINELNLFCSEWLNYLKFHKFDEGQISKAIGLAKFHLSKIDSEFESLKKYQFNGRLLVFEENTSMPQASQLGSIKRERMLINFPVSFQLRHLNLKLILKNACDYYDRNLSIVRLEEETFLMVFREKNFNLYTAIFDSKEAKPVTKILLAEHNCSFIMVKNKAKIFGYLFNQRLNCLRVYNLKFEILKELDLDSYIGHMSVNDTSLVCLSDKHDLLVYDHDLVLKQKSRLNAKTVTDAFYIPGVIHQMKVDNDYMYFFDGTFMRVLKIGSGARVSKFEVIGKDFHVNNDECVIAYDNSANEMSYYDFDGNVIKQVKLDDIIVDSHRINLCEYENNCFSLIDMTHSILYTN